MNLKTDLLTVKTYSYIFTQNYNSLLVQLNF